MIGFGSKISGYNPIIALFGLIVILFLGSQIYTIQRENRNLREIIELVEVSLEEERKEIRVQVDSLELVIKRVREDNCKLQGEILKLEQDKVNVNSKADERKNDILRIVDVDSLHREIARHYRR